MTAEIIRILDITAAVVGIAYLWWEFRASILVWAAGVIMPAIDIALYWEKGLYGDFALAIYYLLAAVYGFLVWKNHTCRSDGLPRRDSVPPRNDAASHPEEKPITHMDPRKWLPIGVIFIALWAGMYFFLEYGTNSTVPVLDSLTNALSIVGMYLLAQKYLEQWFVWLAADIVYVGLYAYKDLPGKSTLYILYCLFAVAGYLNWRRKMIKSDLPGNDL